MHIYVDETKQRDYLLVASVHVSTDLTKDCARWCVACSCLGSATCT